MATFKLLPIWMLLLAARSDYQQRIAAVVSKFMQNYEITYVYGGSAVSDSTTCTACVRCLAEKKSCPVCRDCSLDCSHFISHVFNQAAMPLPYLTTKQMLQFSPLKLKKSYNLLIILNKLKFIRPFDLLVYKGHVVMVEAITAAGRGTVIHVTAGRDLRGAGAGLQRERQVELANFRGPLLRVLRHELLVGG